MENRGRKLQTLSANWKLIFDWMDELLRLIELSESLWQAFDLIWFRLFILFLLRPKFKILVALRGRAEYTPRIGKDHCTADLQLNWFLFSNSFTTYNWQQIVLSGLIQSS